MVTNWNKVEVPSWFGGDEKQWIKFRAWFSKATTGGSLGSKNVPSWFGGDQDQWDEFRIWSRDYIRGLKSKDETIVLKEVPSWFGGDEEQWEDLHGWYKSNG